MPARKRGGHMQGRKATLIAAVPTFMRERVEREADERKETLSDVVRRALARYFGIDENREDDE